MTHSQINLTRYLRLLLLLLPFIGFSQKQISGTVVDDQGIPIIGASVIEKGTSNGTTTDFDGNFDLEIAQDNSVVKISYVGFITKEVEAGSSSVLNITLETDTQSLEEVVVIGYGTQKREEVTTAIATVKSEDFNPGLIQDAGDLIKGKVAGLSISNGSGDPSATSNVSLRGVSTLQGNTQPLILINGLPGSLNSVAPNDIASIDVLKDASASAIYGTRGANGVILITTKSGKVNTKPSLSYSHYVSSSQFTRKADFLDAGDVRRLRADGVNLPQYNDLGYETNWLDAITRTAITQNHNLTFSGGGDYSTYSVNTNYMDQQGVFKKSFNEEFRIGADLTHSMFDGVLKFTASFLSGSQDIGALGDGASFDSRIYRQALIRNPTDRIYNDAGDYVQDGTVLQYVNPVSMIDLTDGDIQSDWVRLNGNITLEPVKGWVNNLFLGSNRNTNLRGFYEAKEYLGYNGDSRNGFASRYTIKSKTDLLEFTSKYSKSFENHSFSVLGGYSYQYNINESFYATNRDFPTNAFGYNNLGQGQGLQNGLASMGSAKDDNTLVGFFGRVSYSYKSRYNLLASMRREGSSKFGTNNKWGNFPAVSVGWNISREEFMENADFVNNLKLRAGYGETGIIPGQSYLSQSLFSYSSRAYLNGEWIRGLTPDLQGGNPNPDLRWEVSREFNVGLDFAFFNNRINGSLDVYRKRTKDLLFDYSVPTPPNLVGITKANVGEMQNQGFELLLNVNPVKTKDFSWDANITLSHNKNELVSLSNDLYQIEGNYINYGTLSEPVSQITHRIEVGQPVSQFWGLKSVDVDYYEARDAFGEGNYWTIELPDGSRVPWDNALDTDENRQFLGNGIPAYNIGITNTFKYKSFDLSFVFTGALDFQILNAQRVFYEYPHIPYNVLNSAFDPVYGKDVTLSNQIGQKFVSYYIENGDYLKLNNVTLGYNFNTTNLDVVDALRLYVSGNNLAIITGYSGIDPEIDRGSVLTQGTDDRDKYPSTRTFTLGLNVNF